MTSPGGHLRSAPPVDGADEVHLSQIVQNVIAAVREDGTSRRATGLDLLRAMHARKPPRLTPQQGCPMVRGMAHVEFFYDYSSPWTYLAFTRIEELCRRHDAELVWRPILVGGIFNTVNPSVYEARQHTVPAKARYAAKDLHDWARFYDLVVKFPPTVFPVNSVKALRGALVALEYGCIGPYSERVFRAYFGEDLDISQDAVLRTIVADVGLDPQTYFAAIASPACKDRIRANTDECVRRGGFGSPTIFVDGDMYFGNDRLVLVEAALRQVR